MRASIPYSLLAHASWATPRVGPMIRMALTHAVRRGLAASVHTHWRCGDRLLVCVCGTGAMGPMATAPAATRGAIRADCSFGAWLRPWRANQVVPVTVVVCYK